MLNVKTNQMIKRMSKIGSKMTTPHLKKEDVRKNLPNINVMNTQLMTKSDEYKSPIWNKFTNELTDEQSLKVQKDNVDNYYKQIMNNIGFPYDDQHCYLCTSKPRPLHLEVVALEV